MSETVACLIALTVVTIAVVTIYYFGKLSHTDSKSLHVKELVAEIKFNKDWGDKILILIVYLPLLLRTGFYGFMVVFSTVAYSGAAIVCGQNPWPYIKDMLFGIFDFFSVGEDISPDDAKPNPATG